MADAFSERFLEALRQQNLTALRAVPKSDLHNHCVLGGNREYIFKRTGLDIPMMEPKSKSIQDMHDWNNKYLSSRFDSCKMRKLLIEAAFEQAESDGVKVLEIGEDVWGNGEFFGGDVSSLTEAFKTAQKEIAPDMELRLQIGLSRHCPISYLEKSLEPFWEHTEFYSIDLYGDELAQPIRNFVPIYRKAKNHGLRLKAHIGEFGTAEDVAEGIRLLNLDEVQHGIAAARSPEIIRFLVENQIRLNICPTSNVMLGRVKLIKDHPIAALYRAGVDVTINSDDILAFDSDVSKEYLRLFQAGVLKAEELDDIRVNGLRKI